MGGAAHALAGNVLYYVGGMAIQDGLALTDRVAAYDVVSDEWTELDAMPTERAFWGHRSGGAVVSGGALYVLGGATAAAHVNWLAWDAWEGHMNWQAGLFDADDWEPLAVVERAPRAGVDDDAVVGRHQVLEGKARGRLGPQAQRGDGREEEREEGSERERRFLGARTTPGAGHRRL